MDFNKIFKIVSISLFSIAALGVLLYIGYASSKDCLGCTLPMCEGITESGEKYLMPADSCALSYEEIQAREQEMREINAAMGVSDDAQISECSQECLNYAGTLMTFSIVFVLIATFFTLLFAGYTLVINRKKIKGVLIGVVGLGLALLVSYLIAKETVPSIIGYTNVITPTEAKCVDTTLYMLYILLTVATVGIIATGINKIIQNNK